jgi:hypothetical protein
MKILALDQAPRTSGFCYGESTHGVKPTWGVQKFPRYDDEVPLIHAYRKWLIGLCEEVGIERIFYEQIIISMQHVHLPTTYQQFAVFAAIAGTCEFLGIKAYKCNIATWRKRALGKNNKPKWAPTDEDDWLKEAAKVACAERNWLIDDHNAAEAALIWDYGCHKSDAVYDLATKPHIQRVLLERENADRAFNGK